MLCLPTASAFSTVEVLTVAIHFFVEISTSLHVRSLCTTIGYSPFCLRCMSDFLVRFPQFPCCLSVWPKWLLSNSWAEVVSLVEMLLFGLLIGIIPHFSTLQCTLTNIRDSQITQKLFLQQTSLVLNTFLLSRACSHMELLRNSCSQIIPDADRPSIQRCCLYWACLCWPFPLPVIAF